MFHWTRLALAATTLFFVPISAHADDHPSEPPRADEHAPIGVMGDHTHPAGEWMVSYRYGRMHMDGNRDGTNRLSLGEVLAPPAGTGSFPVAPTEMDMQMHMFGAMYAPTDWITLMAMVSYVQLDMDHQRADGVRFTTEANGVSDFELWGLVPLLDMGSHRVHANVGLSFPTGSIHERDTLPAPVGKVRLPYPMQIGSGSYEFLPGVTYNGGGGENILSWGAQLVGTVRLNENDNDYRVGNSVDTTAWGAVRITDWMSLSARAAWTWIDDIHGADPQLNPALVPTARADLRKGHRLDLLPGVNFAAPTGVLAGHRLAFEFGVPVYQKLDGPQLETDWRLVVGWQKAF